MDGKNKQPPDLKPAIDLADFCNVVLEITTALDYSSNNYFHIHEATINLQNP
jgi:hypothetical protein